MPVAASPGPANLSLRFRAPLFCVCALAATAAACDGDATEPETAPPAAVVLETDTIALEPGDTARLAAVVRDSAGRTLRSERLTWRSLQPEVAEVDSSGLVRGKAFGQAQVTAAARGGAADTAMVSVVDALLTVRISPPFTRFYSRILQRYRAVLLDFRGDTVPARFRWSSSDTTIATVDSAGVVRTLTPGRAVITAATTGARASLGIEVYGLPPHFFVSARHPYVDAMIPGDTLRYTAEAPGAYGGELWGVQWRSSDTAVASVDATGLVHARTLGYASIIAQVDTLTRYGSVTVTQITGISVQPESAGVLVGGSKKFTASATGGSGRVTAYFSWTASDTSVATVDANGLAVGKKIGTATVHATAGGVSGGAIFEVLPAGEGCAGESGTAHTGANGSDTWRAADNPHRLRGAVSYSGQLVIEPGVVVCGDPDASLTFGTVAVGSRLIARGTPAAPIRFTATNPAARWAGIVFRGEGDQGRISNAIIEHAVTAIAAVTLPPIDSTRIRQSGLAISAWTAPSIRNTTIDTVGNGVVIWQYNATFENVIVRGAARTGIHFAGGSGNFRNVRIEGSGGTGLEFGSKAPSFGTVENLRIVGGGSYPAHLPSGAAVRLLTGQTVSDSLTGNAKDTLLVGGPNPRSNSLVNVTATVYPGLPWRFQHAFTVGAGGVLRLGPGAAVAVPAVKLSFDGGRLHAQGTADSAAVVVGTSWDGLDFAGTPADTSRLIHTRLEGVGLHARAGHPVLLDDLRTAPGGHGILVRSAGSRILNSFIERTQGWGIRVAAANVAIENTIVRGTGEHGIVVEAGNARISRCESSGNAADGVHLAAPGSRVNDCNLFGNAGVGVRNLMADTVDARFNWWGDAAGPNGAAGDGVAGAVDYRDWRTQPVEIGTTESASPAGTNRLLNGLIPDEASDRVPPAGQDRRPRGAPRPSG